MTDEVARLVLRNNYQQSLAISLAQRRGLEDLGFQQRLMQILEKRGLLDRAVEYLPDEVMLADRRKRNEPLTRPELAVLLAYAKLTLYSELLDSDVPDDPYLGRELNRYFPQEMSERYQDALDAHRLRREIIATQLTNSMINRGGATLIVRIGDQTGATSASIAAAFAAVRQSYEMVALNTAIDGLDNKVSGKTQLDLYAAVRDLLLDRLVWFLRNVDLTQGPRDYRRALPRRHRRSRGRARHRAVEAGPGGARRAGGGADQGRCAGRSGAPHRQPAAACGCDRHRAGRRPRQEAGGRSGGDLFRQRGLLPARPRRRRGSRASPCRIISTGWRSTARWIRSATPSGASPRPWSATARPVPTRWRHGSSRGKPRSSASAPRSTTSPARG